MRESPAVIITGAGSGIGRATALRLAERGAALVLAGRREAPLDDTRHAVHEVSPDTQVRTIACDLSTDAGITRLADGALEALGSVQALVNNAGAAALRPIPQTDRALLERMFNVNVYGPALLIGALWETLADQDDACIVNVSSMAAADPFPGFFAYAAAKSAVESLGRSIVNERGEASIRVFTVAPGAVETPMLRGLVSEDVLPGSATLSPAAVAAVIEACIFGRRPDDEGGVIPLPSGSSE
jgi:NAD(P)-dependent dehydrogenase (short-subunit alcohol dehydrogenase family)